MLLKVVRLLDLEILSERTFVKIFLLPLSYTFISQEKKVGTILSKSGFHLRCGMKSNAVKC